MNTPLVNLHIVGVQKAGTSALAHFLSQHSDVCVVEGKEAHVFDQPDFASKDKHEYANKRYALSRGKDYMRRYPYNRI